MAGLFDKAYARVASLQNSEKSFSATGIWPYNPNVFSEVDFAPSTVISLELLESDNNEIIIENEDLGQELLNNLPTDPRVLATHEHVTAETPDKSNLLLDIGKKNTSC